MERTIRNFHGILPMIFPCFISRKAPSRFSLGFSTFMAGFSDRTTCASGAKTNGVARSTRQSTISAINYSAISDRAENEHYFRKIRDATSWNAASFNSNKLTFLFQSNWTSKRNLKMNRRTSWDRHQRRLSEISDSIREGVDEGGKKSPRSIAPSEKQCITTKASQQRTCSRYSFD